MIEAAADMRREFTAAMAQAASTAGLAGPPILAVRRVQRMAESTAKGAATAGALG
jgi:hypothetical protein